VTPRGNCASKLTPSARVKTGVGSAVSWRSVAKWIVCAVPVAPLVRVNEPWKPTPLPLLEPPDRVAGERDRRDAGLGERLQFAIVRDSVPVKIAPDLERGKGRIVRIDNAVCIAVDGLQNREPVLCGGSEQVERAVDDAVSVSVEHENAVTR